MENKRLVKALSEKMYLLSATQKDNEWLFNVRGQTKKIYEQTIKDDAYSCSCPDHQGKKTFCKHLLFLVVRVAKQYELGTKLIKKTNLNWKKEDFIACSLSWVRCLSHLIKHEEVLDETDGICAICFDDLGCDGLTECLSKCHKKFHKLCIDKWLEKGNTCPMCRSDWLINDSLDEKDDVNASLDPISTLNPVVKIEETKLNENNKSDIVISFDTTGSMYPCISEVKRNITSMTERLFCEIPNLRIAIIAHGDYCDKDKVITQLDFTNNKHDIKKFIDDAPSTSGGDYPECYELVLRNTKYLSWSSDATMKSLILIGDAPPHEKNENPEKIDWRLEAESLKNRNIQVFSVQCLNRGDNEAFNFYSEVAEITNGYHVFLDQFSYIKDMIQAICFKQYNVGYLEQFEKEIQECNGGMSQGMRLMFDTMLGKKTRKEAREEMLPSRFHERYTRKVKPIKHYSSSSTSACPSLEHEDELVPSPPSRFQVFTVDEDINIKNFCEKMGIKFLIGRGFYEFTKPEIVQKKKEIILMDKSTGELYEGSVARTIAGIGKNEENKRIKPGELPKYRMFIQSTSPNRKLINGQGFLYEVI